MTTIPGAVTVDSFDDWAEENGEAIGLGSLFDDTVIGVLDLSFFMDYDGPFFKDRGESCFGSRSGFLDPQAGIRKHKGGSVLGAFWFWGCTDEGTVGGDPSTGECKREVKYELDLLGQFDDPDNWPPVNPATTTLTMKSWELFAMNEGKFVKNRSCLGGDDFASDVKILVTRTN